MKQNNNILVIVNMLSSQSSIDSEESKDLESPEDSSKKVQRKNYLKKAGKSLWMKNKFNKNKTLSIEVSTKSSEGILSMGVFPNKPTSVS